MQQNVELLNSQISGLKCAINDIETNVVKPYYQTLLKQNYTSNQTKYQEQYSIEEINNMKNFAELMLNAQQLYRLIIQDPTSQYNLFYCLLYCSFINQLQQQYKQIQMIFTYETTEEKQVIQQYIKEQYQLVYKQYIQLQQNVHELPNLSQVINFSNDITTHHLIFLCFNDFMENIDVFKQIFFKFHIQLVNQLINANTTINEALLILQFHIVDLNKLSQTDWIIKQLNIENYQTLQKQSNIKLTEQQAQQYVNMQMQEMQSKLLDYVLHYFKFLYLLFSPKTTLKKTATAPESIQTYLQLNRLEKQYFTQKQLNVIFNDALQNLNLNNQQQCQLNFEKHNNILIYIISHQYKKEVHFDDVLKIFNQDKLKLEQQIKQEIKLFEVFFTTQANSQKQKGFLTSSVKSKSTNEITTCNLNINIFEYYKGKLQELFQLLLQQIAQIINTTRFLDAQDFFAITYKKAIINNFKQILIQFKCFEYSSFIKFQQNENLDEFLQQLHTYFFDKVFIVDLIHLNKQFEQLIKTINNRFFQIQNLQELQQLNKEFGNQTLNIKDQYIDQIDKWMNKAFENTQMQKQKLLTEAEYDKYKDGDAVQQYIFIMQQMDRMETQYYWE